VGLREEGARMWGEGNRGGRTSLEEGRKKKRGERLYKTVYRRGEGSDTKDRRKKKEEEV
jgi:hypothetical protein